MTQRNRMQIRADAFDLKIFNLIGHAEKYSKDWPSTKNHLSKAIKYLEMARPHVRVLMHPDDVKATQ